MSSRTALVIGIDDYVNMTPLSCCVSDAIAMAEVLQDPKNGFSVTLIQNQKATRRYVKEMIGDLIAQKSDLSLFYFAGHGISTDIGTYLVTCDGEDGEEGIDLDWLHKVVQNRSQSPLVMVLDCCHAGSAAIHWDKGRIAKFQDFNRILVTLGQSRVVLAACTAEQQAAEEELIGHGIFTGYVIDGLSGNAADERGEITVSGLYDYVSAKLNESLAQTPVFRGDITGRVILGRGYPPKSTKLLDSQIAQRIEMQGRQLLDEYTSIKSVNLEEFHNRVYQIARERFEPINHWFDSNTRKHKELSQRTEFKRLLQAKNGHLAELGNLVEGMQIKEGILEKRLGLGAFGTVWRVSQPGTERRLAFKVYHPTEISVVEKVDRFQRGYRAMKQLSHPNVVKVEHFSQCPIGFFMDYIDGPNLRELANALDQEQSIEFMITIGTAINYAHQEGIRHRDIKPENILTKYDENRKSYVPLLCDFDLAWFSTATEITIDGRAFGSMNYASPEQTLRPNSTEAHAVTTDVFSFGKLIYYIICRSDPMPGSDASNERRLRDALREYPSAEASRLLLDLYLLCTKDLPSKRAQSFDEVLDALLSVRMALHRTSKDDLPYNEIQFTNELAFSLTGVADAIMDMKFHSPSGRIAIFLDYESKGVQRGVNKYAIVARLITVSSFGLPGISNDTARKRINQRIDFALQKYPFVKRRSGREGYFEVWLDFTEIPLNRQGVIQMSPVFRAIIDSIERI